MSACKSRYIPPEFRCEVRPLRGMNLVSRKGPLVATGREQCEGESDHEGDHWIGGLVRRCRWSDASIEVFDLRSKVAALEAKSRELEQRIAGQIKAIYDMHERGRVASVEASRQATTLAVDLVREKLADRGHYLDGQPFLLPHARPVRR